MRVKAFAFAGLLFCLAAAADAAGAEQIAAGIDRFSLEIGTDDVYWAGAEVHSAAAGDAVEAADIWVLENRAVVIEYNSIYDVHTPLNPDLPIRSQGGGFYTGTILEHLETVVEPEHYNFVLLYSIQEAPGWINSGSRGISVSAKNIGLFNSSYGNPPRYANWPGLYSAPHMNSVDFLDRPVSGRPRYGSTLTAIHEIGHNWCVFWAQGSPGPRGWNQGDPVAWLASASAHWTWVWLEAGMPGIMYSGPTSERFNAFDLYSMGLMHYDEARGVTHQLYEYEGGGVPPDPVIHEVTLDDLIYSLSLRGGNYYEEDGRRYPAVSSDMERLHTLIVVIKETAEEFTAGQRQLVMELAEYLPGDWSTATWGRSSMAVDICRRTAANFDGDETVNMRDFAIFSSYWGRTNCAGPQWCGGSDFDESGTVDMKDVMELAAHWLWELCP